MSFRHRAKMSNEIEEKNNYLKELGGIQLIFLFLSTSKILCQASILSMDNVCCLFWAYCVLGAVLDNLGI
jgi:hypothetical protein